MRRFSPYAYALDNPIYFIDPDGMEATTGDTGASETMSENDFDVKVDAGYGRMMKSKNLSGAISYSGASVSMNKNGQGKFLKASEKDRETKDGDDPISANYKGKTKTGDATPQTLFNKPNKNSYNCHSFAWCDSQGDPTDPKNGGMVLYGLRKWDNDPTNNMEGYTALKFDDPNQIGDRLIYQAWNEELQKVEITHSAIVTKVDENGRAIEVESKWGESPQYKHHPRDVPSIYSSREPTFVAPDGKTYQSRIYYRQDQ